MVKALLSFSSPGPSIIGAILCISGALLYIFGPDGSGDRAGELIVTGIGIAMCRQNNITSEQAGAK